jgi:hypothetical protein
MESLISLDYILAYFLAAESPSLLSQPAPTGFLTFSSDFGTLKFILYIREYIRHLPLFLPFRKPLRRFEQKEKLEIIEYLI